LRVFPDFRSDAVRVAAACDGAHRRNRATVHHVVIMFWRRRAAAENPIEQIGVGAIEQRFESVELGAIEVRERSLGERAKNEVAFLRSAMPASEQQPPTANVAKIVP